MNLERFAQRKIRLTALWLGALGLAACAEIDQDIYREFEVGRTLMERCRTTGDADHCATYYAFKADWERKVNHATTFEAGLRGHDTRTAGR